MSTETKVMGLVCRRATDPRATEKRTLWWNEKGWTPDRSSGLLLEIDDAPGKAREFQDIHDRVNRGVRREVFFVELV